MRPYETIEELAERIQELEKARYDARHLRWMILSKGSGEMRAEDEAHFELFEQLVSREMEEILFHLEMEKLFFIP